MNIVSLVEVFRMTELPAKTRADIIIKLGRAINNEVGMNLTEPIVWEFVNILDSGNPILRDEAFVRLARKP